jgi:C4-dicarboxylate-specific signal transduction histidine kinase
MKGAGANPVGRARESPAETIDLSQIGTTAPMLDREVEAQRLVAPPLAFDAKASHLARLAAIGDMLAGIAHEISQPLFAIQNYAQATIYSLSNSAPVDRDALLSFARQIATAVERAGGIANQLRAFGSKSDPCPAYNNIGEIVESAIELVRPDLRRKRIVVQTDLADDATTVFADRGLIVQVLVFLLKNACEACDALPIAEARIAIRTRPEDDFIRISMLDEGVGLPHVDLSTLFEPFFTTKADNLGIGLSVSRSIVEAARGRLWAEANSPRGSIFHFMLPRGPEVSVGK